MTWVFECVECGAPAGWASWSTVRLTRGSDSWPQDESAPGPHPYCGQHAPPGSRNIVDWVAAELAVREVMGS